MLNNSTKKSKVYRNAMGNIVAKSSGKFLKKKVYREKHLLKIYNAYAFDESIIIDAKKRGVEKVEITEKDTGAILTCNIDLFAYKGIHFDFGYGPQIALALECWQIIDTVSFPNQPGLF